MKKEQIRHNQEMPNIDEKKKNVFAKHKILLKNLYLQYQKKKKEKDKIISKATKSHQANVAQIKAQNDLIYYKEDERKFFS